MKTMEADKKKGAANTDQSKLMEQLEDALSQNKKLSDDYEGMKSANRKSKIQSEARVLAATLTKDTARASLLAEKISGRLDIDSDVLVVLSEDGKQTISSTDDLKAAMAKSYPFLVDGTNASGGGAQGGSGGAAKTKEMPRADYQKLSASDQSKFINDGGIPI